MPGKKAQAADAAGRAAKGKGAGRWAAGWRAGAKAEQAEQGDGGNHGNTSAKSRERGAARPRRSKATAAGRSQGRSEVSGSGDGPGAQLAERPGQSRCRERSGAAKRAGQGQLPGRSLYGVPDRRGTMRITRAAVRGSSLRSLPSAVAKVGGGFGIWSSIVPETDGVLRI